MTRRLLLSAVALVAVVLLILTVPLASIVARAARDRLAAAVERDAMVIASTAEDNLERGEPADLAVIVAAYRDRTGGRVVIVDAAGVSVADSDPPVGSSAEGRDFSTRAEIQTALDGLITTGSRFSETLGEGFLYVAVPVASGNRIHGAVRISYPTAAVEARIARSRWTLAGIAALALLAAAIVGLVLARWVVTPLRRVEHAAERLAAGDLHARAPENGGPPELRQLAATLNTMAARLEDLIAGQRAFIADASHQLRTPLTALRLRLEGLELFADPDDASELAAATHEVLRLGRLVDGLLTLARAEGAQPAATPVDAADCVRQRAAAWEPLAAEQGVALRVAGVDHADVLAVEGALDQVLDNLLANALRLAPDGSTITMATTRDHHSTMLTVADEGPGMTPEQRGRAFDRFWRSPGGDRDGFGLGLAIVDRLVRASGGQIRLEEAPGGGLLARITLRSAARTKPTPTSAPVP